MVMTRNIGDVLYSYGQNNNLTTAPTVYRSEIWHVHQYTGPLSRYTWDISDGRVLECRHESWGKLARRNHPGWRCDYAADWPCPVTLQEA
jgi:hypothetical protein